MCSNDWKSIEKDGLPPVGSCLIVTIKNHGYGGRRVALSGALSGKELCSGICVLHERNGYFTAGIQRGRGVDGCSYAL